MTKPTWTPGRFVWRELMTTDVAKAKGFYGELFNWSFTDADMGGGFTYTMAKCGDVMVGGLMKRPDGVSAPPHWLSYVSVRDVDSAVAAAKKDGGSVANGPVDVPNVGRLATLSDPDGAYFAIMRGAEGDMPQPERPPLGAFCWETVVTKDAVRAQKFYGAVLGWTTTAGPGGDSDIPVFAAGEAQVADVQIAKDMPPCWMTYVVVENVDASRDRAAKLGANVVVPRVDVPHVGAISFVADPTGAVIGLFQPNM